MGRKSRHGPSTTLRFGKTEKELIDFVHAKIGNQKFHLSDLKRMGWDKKDGNTRRVIWSLIKKNTLKRVKKGEFILALPDERKEIPIAARKYLSSIEEKIREFKSQKQKIEKETKEQIAEIDSFITKWQEIKQRFVREPELAALIEELEKLRF